MNKLFWTSLCFAAALAAAAEESATINRNHVNVRGAPTLNSEIVARLQKGAKVTFLEEIPVAQPKKDEPARWAAIKLPEGAKAWVFIPFLADNKVKVPRLNVRAGRGENFSVLARLERGAEVKELGRSGEWMQIDPPESARAYVDASFIDRAAPEAGQEIAEVAKPVLEQKPVVYEPPAPKPALVDPVVTNTPPPVIKEVPTVVADTPKPEPTPPPVIVAETPVEEKEPTPAPLTKPAGEVGGPGAAPAPVLEGPVDTDTPKRILPPVGPAVAVPNTIPVTEKRVVRREGEVRSTKFNPQAPTYFELVGERGRKLNYLSGEKAGFQLKDYKGLRVIVTGEESIDPRYPDRPLLELETIEMAP